VGILCTVIVTGLLAPVVGLEDPNRQHLDSAFVAPSVHHLFGTDELGRDIFSRCVYATRVDMVFALIVTFVPVVLGMVLGVVAGFFGRWVDVCIMRLVDIVLALPFIVLVLALVAILGPGLKAAYVGVLCTGWALYARLTRGEMLVLRERDFILAAQTLGFTNLRVIGRHALPNLIRPNLVFSVADFVLNLLLLASLSYLGVGVQPPTPEWGAMVADGQSYLLTAWWVSTLPGVVIVTVGLGMSLLGDGLADWLGQDFKLAA
jgi:peptide/nickel transport system permease protein